MLSVSCIATALSFTLKKGMGMKCGSDCRIVAVGEGLCPSALWQLLSQLCCPRAVCRCFSWGSSCHLPG